MSTSLAAQPPSTNLTGTRGATDAAVRLQGLTKSFPARRTWWEMLRHPWKVGHTPALREVTCDIRRGEFFGLLGPNGAGKTTLFKILATLIEPDEGTATVGGFDIRRDAPSVRRILTPVIGDERSLQWRLSAQENLRLFAVLYDVPARVARARINDLLELVGLSDAGEKLVGAFSSGMKQRLLIARALIPEPAVLLLDEPTRSLDPLSARSLRTFLREEICERRGCTVLLATHNTEEAFELCDRVAILDRGRLLAAGPTAELIRSFGDMRYRVWTTTPEHRVFAALAADVACGPLVKTPAEDGWTQIEFELAEGMQRAAQVLDLLVSQGAVIARFELAPLSLADLIRRVVERKAAVHRA